MGVIDKVFDRRHKLGDVWRWARHGKVTYQRFARAKAWAHMHKRYNWKKSHHAEKLKHASARKRYASRARHWGHIERLYRQEQRRLRRRKRRHQLPSGDLVTFDGKPHAGWLVRESLIPARKSGEWPGISYSGYRTPELCDALCRAMCGQAVCPGMCAGRGSNHAKLQKPGGAADVTYSSNLSGWESRHGYPSRHTLPRDLPHHSLTGQ